MGLWQDKVSDQSEGIALEKYQTDPFPQAWALGIDSTEHLLLDRAWKE